MTILSTGLVLRIPDYNIRPAGKPKWHLCVCDFNRWFLRINSRPLWQPHMSISKAANPWLKHDSFIELRQVCIFSRADIDAALADPAGIIGKISRSTAATIVAGIRFVVTLTEDEKDMIARNLSRL